MITSLSIHLHFDCAQSPVELVLDAGIVDRWARHPGEILGLFVTDRYFGVLRDPEGDELWLGLEEVVV